MSELKFTTVNRIFSKFHRELRGTDLNESDIIEWIGEALEFLRVPQIQEQAIAFLEVKNHDVKIPDGFQMVLQIARNNYWEKEKCTPKNTLKEIQQEETIDGECVECNPCNDVLITDCEGFVLDDNEIVGYRPGFDMKLNYQYWRESGYYKRNYSPVRLANSTFYNTIVCKEKVDDGCKDCTEEYTIVGTTEKKLRFSFSEGQVALSYLKNAIDEETGYPLIPDEIACITAITYYVRWKLSEWYFWNGRAGSDSLVTYNQTEWLRYVKQAKNYMKMPKSLDDYQDLLEQTHYLIPNHKKYYSYFGNLGRSQHLRFNDNI